MTKNKDAWKKPWQKNWMVGVLRGTTAVVIGVLTACTSSNHDGSQLARNVEASAIKMKGGDILDLDSVNKGKWDRVFIFQPYTSNQEIETAINSALPPSIIESGISERDDVNLLVFMSGGDVQLVAIVSRSAVDFAPPPSRPILKAMARFSKQDVGGKLTLASQN